MENDSNPSADAPPELTTFTRRTFRAPISAPATTIVRRTRKRAPTVREIAEAVMEPVLTTLGSSTEEIVPDTAMEEAPPGDGLEMSEADIPVELVDTPIELNENAAKFAQELVERDAALASGIDDDEFGFLYPTLDDPNFAANIAARKEFFDSQYDGKVRDIKAYADAMCGSKFELLPHQMFVKNFMSFQTPYNSLFMYHELGTGKTCSAIGIAEEMRSYLKNVGIVEQIIVIASPNVQKNFMMQLFNEREMYEDAGIWSMRSSCIGNKLIREINTVGVKGLSREQVIQKVNKLIKRHYLFMGYIEFANILKIIVDPDMEIPQSKETMVKRIRDAYNGRLIIVDEVHNLNTIGDSHNKLTSKYFEKIVKYTETMRLLLLSATPMYNSYEEIINTVNLLNMNDGRAQITAAQVFRDKEGNFKEPKDGNEGGLELLRRKMVGYISYVRGENPYTFPFRIYPTYFSPEHTFLGGVGTVPTEQFNGKPVPNPLAFVPVYLVNAGAYQEAGYSAIVRGMRIQQAGNMDNKLLEIPLQSLNMVFPSEELDRAIAGSSLQGDMREIAKNMVGEKGLARVMSHTDDSHKNPPARYDFEYTPNTLEKYGRIFQLENLRKYSSKISNICDCVLRSTGIVMVYAWNIDGGAVPLALALEELGLVRYSASGVRPLFAASAMRGVEQLDARTMRPRDASARNFIPARYAMIVGNKSFSSDDNSVDMKRITSSENRNGEQVKVVIISKAGAEGLDFKNIRQIHVMDAWYNMSRIQQTIGRGVRNLSHCSLPFEERNVEIYLYATLLPSAPNEESVDLYVYRMAERKAIQIGRITRILKESAVDCLLNIQQTNFTAEKLLELAANQRVNIRIASGKTIEFVIGDKPFSEACDYMENCTFDCGGASMVSKENVKLSSYAHSFASANNDAIIQRIHDLFKDRHVYSRANLVAGINVSRQYPIAQIYVALSHMVSSESEILLDKYGRSGRLVNAAQYYTFQPTEITDVRASVYDRQVPVDYRREKMAMEISTLNVRQPQLLDANSEPLNPPTNTFASIIVALELNLRDAFRNEKPRVPQSRWSWYMHAGTALRHIEIVHSIPRSVLEKYILHHAIDTMTCRFKLTIVDEIYKDGWEPQSDTHAAIKDYFDKMILRVGERLGIIMINSSNNIILYIRSGEPGATWKEEEPVDRSMNVHGAEPRYFGNEIQRLYKRHPAKVRKVPYIGFLSFFEVSSEIVFKVKNMQEVGRRKCRGSRIDQAGKPKIINILNHVAGRPVYDNTNTNTMSPTALGVVLEMLMRYITVTTKPAGDLLLFFTGETAYFNKELLGI